jgi:PAS domain S-box-containing protein
VTTPDAARLLDAHEWGGAHPFEWNARTGKAVASPGFRALFGIEEEAELTQAVIRARVHRADLDAFDAGHRRLLAGGGTFDTEFRIVLPGGEVRWINARGAALLDARGKPYGISGVNLDITARKEIEAALAVSERQFRVLAETMPQIVWSALPDGFHDYYNGRWYDFVGRKPGSTDGEGWNGMFHPEDQARAWDRWNRSLETGEPYEIEYRLRRHDGVYRWMMGRALPVRDGKGRIERWIGTCTDIHDSKVAADALQLAGRELAHRIKNLFAVVTSIVSMSARHSKAADIAGYSAELMDRLTALGRIQAFVGQPAEETPGGGATLAGLIGAMLAPYDDGRPGRVAVDVPDVPLAAAAVTPFALLLHELATNAAKYGALSVDGGSVKVTAVLADGMLKLVWRESGGPGVAAPPVHKGFGVVVVDGSARQLGGRVERRWEAGGLVAELMVPLDAVRAAA